MSGTGTQELAPADRAADEAVTVGELVERGSTSIGIASPQWLMESRDAALARAAELGLPSPTDEAWRHTDPRPILGMRAAFPTSVGSSRISDGADPCDHVLEVGETDGAAARLVFVDGSLAPALCDLSALPDGVDVRCFGLGAAESDDRDARELLGPITRDSIAGARDGLEALNAGLAFAGVVVRVRADVALDRPIVVVFRAEDRESALLTAPHVTLLVEEGAKASIIEDHQGAPVAPGITGPTGLTLSRTEVRIGRGGEAIHATLQREAPGRHHVSTLRLIQSANARFHGDRILLGGATVRNSIHATIEGEDGLAVFNGLYLPEDRQHHDSDIRIEHLAPNCNSRQFYRGILADRARSVFTGRIYVKDVAQKTDAIQSNSNLLLSPAAQSMSKPQLEIYADDVRCTHGATSGQVDEDAMFYLRARGISRDSARLLLLHAFAGENIDRIADETLRAAVRTICDRRLAAAVERHT